MSFEAEGAAVQGVMQNGLSLGLRVGLGFAV